MKNIICKKTVGKIVTKNVASAIDEKLQNAVSKRATKKI